MIETCLGEQRLWRQPARGGTRRGSERPRRLFEKCDFIGSRTSVECGVSVGKTAESIDDHLVGHCIACPLIIAEALDQIDSKRLVSGIFAVFERKVEKIPFFCFHCHVKALCDGGFGKSACSWIGGKGPEVVSVQIA
jgi:hypothetical protein